MSLAHPPPSHVEEREHRFGLESLRARYLSNHSYSPPLPILPGELLFCYHHPVVAGFGTIRIDGAVGHIILVQRSVLDMQPDGLLILFLINDRSPQQHHLPTVRLWMGDQRGECSARLCHPYILAWHGGASPKDYGHGDGECKVPRPPLEPNVRSHHMKPLVGFVYVVSYLICCGPYIMPMQNSWHRLTLVRLRRANGQNLFDMTGGREEHRSLAGRCIVGGG